MPYNSMAAANKPAAAEPAILTPAPWKVDTAAVVEATVTLVAVLLAMTSTEALFSGAAVLDSVANGQYVV